jgi:hypothetical protein
MKIQLNSGFQSGGWVSRWDGKEFKSVARAAENTYHDDGDSSKEVIVEDGFKGAIGEFHGVSSHSYQSSVRLVGFSEEELSAPTTVGWDNVGYGLHAEECKRLKDFGDYLRALANNSLVLIPEDGRIHPISGNRLVKLPYEWGCQFASHYAVISPKGEIIREESGCGDHAPSPIEGKMDWEFTSTVIEVMENQARFDRALDRGLSSEWLPVLRHLRASYSVPINPLKGLRKKYPGTWTYYSVGKCSQEITEGDVIFDKNDVRDWEVEGSGWRVIYSPTKK